MVGEKKAKPGMRLGKYELGITLGQGNFGKVKLARNLHTGHLFAIKILDKNKIFNLNITDQIKREISTLKLLKHPNIVRLYEVEPVLDRTGPETEFSKFIDRGPVFEKARRWRAMARLGAPWPAHRQHLPWRSSIEEARPRREGERQGVGRAMLKGEGLLGSGGSRGQPPSTAGVGALEESSWRELQRMSMENL